MPTGSRVSPRDVVAQLEATPAVPPGEADRFSGYGVMGLYFPSGDVLAFRRFAASSVGPAYSSVWHRDRTGRWVFYQDSLPHLGCSRYFSAALDSSLVAPIRMVWSDAFTFTIIVGYGKTLEWSLTLAPGGRASAIARLAGWTPGWIWRHPRALRALTGAARAALGAGRLRLEGRTPNAHRFVAHPTRLWSVASSRAVIAGRDTGDAIRPREQVQLGDYWLPKAPLFATAHVEMFSG